MPYSRLKGDKGKPFNSKPYSPFSFRPHPVDPRFYFGVFIPLTSYTEQRFVSSKQVTYFARKKWVALTKNRNRVYVCELCPEEIDDHLGA